MNAFLGSLNAFLGNPRKHSQKHTKVSRITPMIIRNNIHDPEFIRIDHHRLERESTLMIISTLMTPLSIIDQYRYQLIFIMGGSYELTFMIWRESARVQRDRY